jgi:hypothetical protein
MFGSHLLSGFNLRRCFRSRPRPARRRTGYRPSVAVEASRLEERALMTTFHAFGYVWSNEYRNNLEGNGWFSSKQQWAPQNAIERDGHLYLRLGEATVDGFTAVSSAELELVGKAGDPKPWHPGYGTYLTILHTPVGFNDLDKEGRRDVNFGVFTYQKDADPSQLNRNHELDIAEIGRFNGMPNTVSNAQFTLQPAYYGSTYNNAPAIHRITIPNNPQYITLVMQWDGPNQPVTFREYTGIHTLETYLRATPDNTWTTGNGTNGQPNQNVLIPNDGDQTVHFNLWRSPGDSSIPPNTHLNVEIVYFQYKPLEGGAG